MKLLYIAGPYRAKTILGRIKNIYRAWRVGREVARRLGPEWYPIIPHMNTAMMDGAQPDSYFLRGTMEQLETCDAVLVQGEYLLSRGTQAELRRARRLGMPVYFEIGEITNG